VAHRRWRPASVRDWSSEDLSAWWVQRIERDWDDYECLLDDEGYLLLQHDQVEASTGQPYTRIEQVSWVGPGSGVLRQAQAAGLMLKVELADEQPAFAAAGFQSEMDRIVYPLYRQAWNELPFARLTERVPVRRGDEDDRLALMVLADQCVPYMFSEREGADRDGVVGRFMSNYGSLPLGPHSDFWLYVAERAPFDIVGALVLLVKYETAVDGRRQAYIHDLSVAPSQWGRSVGAALVLRAIEGLGAEGIGYLLGDISVTNSRIRSLADRFGFEPEARSWVWTPNKGEDA
jgi:ribosomal protein S18 acetylase RimI-like enzyme